MRRALQTTRRPPQIFPSAHARYSMELKTRETSSALERMAGARAQEEERTTTHGRAGRRDDADEARRDEERKPSSPALVIESEEDGVSLHLGDLWRYRELLYFLTWRDVKVRYKQTLMGALWVVIQPLAQMLLFTVVLHRFAGLDSGSVPYPLFVFAGLLLWTFFSNAVLNGTYSLISNTNLITKVYFPRVFIPTAATVAGVLDLAIASLILVGLVVYYGVALSWSLLLLPFFVALAVLLALGVGLLISALTVKYRDLRHALPFTLQFWMFATPVIYPLDVLEGAWRQVLIFNPMTGVVEGFRAALTGSTLDAQATAVAAVVTFALLIFSFYVFRRTEDGFADVI